MIPALKISDYNTRGLEGSDDGDDAESGSWYKLVKAIGENKMSGAGGGSYGIGKGAPIAASLLHTVYYSTQNISGEHIFQGRAILMTHEHERKKKRGSGFYGIKGYQSIRNKKIIPEKFRRSELGTDIYVIAYKPESEDWKLELTKSVLENFWMAVKTKDLVVNFKDKNGSLLIDSESLEQMLLKYLPEDTYQYYLAVVKPTRSDIATLPTLGSCELYLRQDPLLMNKKDVVLMRLPKMSVKKRPFRIMNDGFVGVMLCNNSEGNKLLRDMEPPKHDEWDFELSPDKPKARKALNELYDWIKSVLRAMANTSNSDPEEIPELDRFLPLEEDGSGSGLGYDNSRVWTRAQGEESPKEINKVQEEKQEDVEDFVQRFNEIKKTAGNKPQNDFQGKGRNKEKGGHAGDPNSKGEAFARINTDGIRFRAIAVKNPSGLLEYCLIINPSIEQEGALNIVAVGDDNNYPVEIASAVDWNSGSSYETKGSTIKKLKLEKGNSKKIRLVLNNRKVKYALGVESYEG